MTRYRDGTSLPKQAHQHTATHPTPAIDTEKITRDYAGHTEGHDKTV